MRLRTIAIGAAIGAGVGYAYRRFLGGGSPSMGDFGAGEDDTPATQGPDDLRLTEKVKSEIFRDPDLPKGQVNVNTEFGKVILRGQVESDDMVERLVEAARNVQGVKDVESLLEVGAASTGDGGDGAGAPS
jgi:osmotically-inducible protein OsmY